MSAKEATEGDILVIQPSEPESPASAWRFTKFDGKEWNDYQPETDEEWESLVTSRTSKKTGIIINL